MTGIDLRRGRRPRASDAQRALARAHPGAVALERVDLAVVGEVAEGLAQVPGAQGVRAVTRVDQRQRRIHLGIVQVEVEGLDLARHQQAGEREGAAGEAGDVRKLAAIADRVLEQAADHVELALEGVLVEAVGGAHEDLVQRGHALARHPTDGRRIAGDGAPAQQALSLPCRDLVEELDLLAALGLVLREEEHARCEGSGGRQLDVALARGLAEEAIGQLDQDARAVAGLRVAAAGATMLEALEDLDSLADQVVGSLAPDVRHEADTTGVVLLGRVVEALGCDSAEPVGALAAHRAALLALIGRPSWRASRYGGGAARRRRGSSASVNAMRERSAALESTTIVSV